VAEFEVEAQPSKTFYFAEGYTGRDVFEEYLTIMNPNSSPAQVTITYMFRDGSTQEQRITVGPTTRDTVMVNSVVGMDREVSMKVSSDLPIVAERPMYFNYKGRWTGGHVAVGAGWASLDRIS
jgi:hypothetical protein